MARTDNRDEKRTSKFFPWVSFLSLFFLFDGKWLSLRLKSPAACFTRFGEISGELVENFRRAYGSVRDSRLPTRSALNGAHRAPAPPDEGSCVPVARVQDRPERKRRPLRKTFRRKPFLPSCVCRRRLRPQGRCPRTPTAFEKAGKTFTCLAKTQARAFGLAALSRPRRP